MLKPTVLDAFIAAVSTAFFGALVAGGAYLGLHRMQDVAEGRARIVDV